MDVISPQFQKNSTEVRAADSAGARCPVEPACKNAKLRVASARLWSDPIRRASSDQRMSRQLKASAPLVVRPELASFCKNAFRS
jgi:hypothetical protein